MEHQEIEVRFLEIDKETLIARLQELGAKDLGEDMLEEVIIYDKELSWQRDVRKMLRIRSRAGKIHLTFKHHHENSATGTEEIEFEINDIKKAEALLDRLGYVSVRHQQKLRHTFHLGDVIIDIDTWPKVPTYVELEGTSEESLKEAAELLGLDWSLVELRNPRDVLEKVYNIHIATMTWFTFDRFE